MVKKRKLDASRKSVPNVEQPRGLSKRKSKERNKVQKESGLDLGSELNFQYLVNIKANVNLTRQPKNIFLHKAVWLFAWSGVFGFFIFADNGSNDESDHTLHKFLTPVPILLLVGILGKSILCG